MYKIFPAYVPVIGRYLHVYLFVWIEGEWWKFHHFTGRLSRFYMSYEWNPPGLNRKAYMEARRSVQIQKKLEQRRIEEQVVFASMSGVNAL